MSKAELSQWVEYYNKEPFGYDRLEVQLAQLSDIMVKTAGDKDTDAIDFMISVSADDKEHIKADIKQKKVIQQLKDF